MSLFIEVIIGLWFYATVWFIFGIIKKRNDVADVAWGIGFCFVVIYLFFTKNPGIYVSIIYGLVMIWGLRLSIHIYNRHKDKPEDFRYANWRKEWGKAFYLRSYLQVYLLQAFFLFIICSPLIYIASFNDILSLPFTAIGIVTWLLGFVWESVGDFQLSQFVKNRRDKNQIMTSGLWKYSRHPNYFGEILMWWGIFIIIIPLPNSFYFIISPLTITILLRYVSGVPMLEAKYDQNEEFQKYKQRTPAVIPKFWLLH